jgi:acyl-CoA synthetase (NDP forming)
MTAYPTDFESAESDAAAEADEQRAVAASLLPLFYPRSVAVVGASRDEHSIGGGLMRNILGARFSGTVYPVNPNAPSVSSVKAYPSVTDIPDPVDLAIVVVPARFVLDVARDCAAKGVKGIVVISAGFSETGEAGRELEEELVAIVRDAGMRMVGPNCMGLLNTDPAVRLDVTFAPAFPPQGNVGMSSQSGALGIAILDYARQSDIGISTFVSVGNKADVSGNDLMLYWEGDPATDVILLYLESFGHPRRFARIARRLGRTKPVVVVKSGRTAAGARAASSHTGALASVEVAVSALFRQAGVIRTDTLEELFEVIVVFIPTGPGALEAIQTAVAEVVADGTSDKTILAVYMEAATNSRPPVARSTVRIPQYAFPEPAARALARATRYSEWRARPEGEHVEFGDVDRDRAQEVLDSAIDRFGADGGWLEPTEAEAILAAYGIPHARSEVVQTAAEAVAAATRLGGSVVLKVVSATALHKSDVGGLAIDVPLPEVADAFDRVFNSVDDATGVLVQEFVADGHEVIIGMTEDPSFGPLIAFGLGGVFVELIGDVSFRIHPLTDADVVEMITEVKSARLLEGYRGGAKGDIPALRETLLRISTMVDDLAEIVEMDLNPVKVLEPGRGLTVVDLRIRIRPMPESWLPSRKDIPAVQPGS